jgi:hypothetical protein
MNTTRVEPAQARGEGLPLSTLNHISVLCRCLPSSLGFYTDVLGFVPIRRPGSLDFAGAWYVRAPAFISKKMHISRIIARVRFQYTLTNGSVRSCVQ